MAEPTIKRNELPEDWGDGFAPDRIFVLSDEWADLKDRYAAFADSGPLKKVYAILEEAAEELRPTHALLEREYIDADYRDVLSQFYASMFTDMSSRCERLHFFRNGAYLGYLTLRPLRARPVSRTILEPPDGLAAAVSCQAPSLAHIYQYERQVTGFPFIQQDGRYGICAHAAIWMVALYHHLRHQTRRVFFSDIVHAANIRSEADRTAPSTGLTVAQIGTAFRELGLPCLRFDVGRWSISNSPEDVVCRYLNSRLPVIVVHPEHATVLIGYGRDEDGKLFFVRHDDSRGPYIKVRADDDPLSAHKPISKADVQGEWVHIIIPLPGRLYLADGEAETAGRDHLLLLGETDELRDLPVNWKAGPLGIYAVRGIDYKRRMKSRGLPADVVDRQARVAISNWIWVIEILHPEVHDERCVIGELVLDATAVDDPRPVFANFPGWTFIWGETSSGEAVAHANSRGKELLLTGSAVHTPTTPPG